MPVSSQIRRHYPIQATSRIALENDTEFCYSYPSHVPAFLWIQLLGEGYHARGGKGLLGHKDVTTTMLCPYVLDRGPAAVQSPADRLSLAALPHAERDCKASRPTAERLNTRRDPETTYNRRLPTQTEVEGQRNKLHPSQRLRK